MQVLQQQVFPQRHRGVNARVNVAVSGIDEVGERETRELAETARGRERLVCRGDSRGAAASGARFPALERAQKINRIAVAAGVAIAASPIASRNLACSASFSRTAESKCSAATPPGASDRALPATNRIASSSP